MKHFKLLFLFVLALTVASCSDDDESNQPIDAQALIGTWEMIELQADTQASGTALGVTANTIGNSVGSNFDYTLTFTEDMYNAQGSYDLTTTGTINGEALEPETETVSDQNVMGSYAVENGEIVFEGIPFLEDELFEGTPADGDFNISTTIDGNGNLVIVQDIEFSVMESGEFPVDLNSTATARIVFTRVAQ